MKVADGTPQELQANCGMHIVEVLAEDPYAAQAAIHEVPEAVSVTQLGVRLRVLIPEHHPDPLPIVERALNARGVNADASVTYPTLEDVFVAVTMKPEERAA